MVQIFRFGLAACLAVCGVGLANVAQAASVTYELPNLYTGPETITCDGVGYASPFLGPDRKWNNSFGTSSVEANESFTFLQVNLQQTGQVLPEGAVITGATLSFNIEELSQQDPTWTLTSFDANGQLYCWQSLEDLQNPLYDPAYQRDAYSSTSGYTIAATGAHSIDVTDLLEERVAQTANPQWFGLFITQTGNGYADTLTGSDPDAAQVRLVVTYDVPAPVPEPATMSLLGIGLVGFAVRAYRRRLKS